MLNLLSQVLHTWLAAEIIRAQCIAGTESVCRYASTIGWRKENLDPTRFSSLEYTRISDKNGKLGDEDQKFPPLLPEIGIKDNKATILKSAPNDGHKII